MTKQELETKNFEYRDSIATAFKDIQMQANTLKNPDDDIRTNQILARIMDSIADIQRAYSNLRLLEGEKPDEEENPYDKPNIFC